MCFVLKTLFFFSDCQLNGIIWPKRGARWRGGMEAWPSLGKSHTLVAEVNPTNDRPATTNGFRQDKTRRESKSIFNLNLSILPGY